MSFPALHHRIATTQTRGATLLLVVTLVALGALGACGDGSERVADSAGAAPRSPAPAATAATLPAERVDAFGDPFPEDASAGERVVSLNPTVTELLYAMRAESHLVARTDWDEYPARVKSLPSVGNAIRPNVEAVLAARPTLVFIYASADNRAAVEALHRAGVRTVALKVDHIADFGALARVVGVAVGEPDAAARVRDSVMRTLDSVRVVTASATRPDVVWPAWFSPPMVIAGGSYLDELLEIAGARNVFHDLPTPSPQVAVEEIARRAPSLVVTSAATAEKLRASPQWRTIGAVRDGRFVIEDPALTGRPSVTLGMAAAHLARLVHPELASRLP